MLQKIDKNYAKNLINKALRGEKVGSGKGCQITIEWWDGFHQTRSYLIENNSKCITYNWFEFSGSASNKFLHNGSSRDILSLDNEVYIKESIDKWHGLKCRYSATVTWHN